VIRDISVSDLEKYRRAILSLEGYDQSCGFICGLEELQNWNPLELCHLLHTTKDYYGTLSLLLPDYTEENVRDFVLLSVGNLYHEICHRYVHAPKEKSVEKLPFSYRGVFFILQNLHYLETGCFLTTKKELGEALDGEDRLLLDTAALLKSDQPYDFDEALSLIFSWCKKTLRRAAKRGRGENE